MGDNKGSYPDIFDDGGIPSPNSGGALFNTFKGLSAEELSGNLGLTSEQAKYLTEYDPTLANFVTSRETLKKEQIGNERTSAEEMNKLAQERLAGQSKDVRESIGSARKQFGYTLEDSTKQISEIMGKSGFAGSGVLNVSEDQMRKRLESQFADKLTGARSQLRDIGIAKRGQESKFSSILSGLQNQLQQIGLSSERERYGIQQDWLENLMNMAARIKQYGG